MISNFASRCILLLSFLSFRFVYKLLQIRRQYCSLHQRFIEAGGGTPPDLFISPRGSGVPRRIQIPHLYLEENQVVPL